MSFLRTIVFLCLAITLFNLSVTFISSLGVFPIEFESGAEEELELNLDYVWSITIGFGTAFTLIVCILMRSVIPLGLYVFSLIFWGSWISAQSILSTGGYVPAEFIALVTFGVAVLFGAAIVGILTGSG